MELRTVKDKVSSLQSQAGKDKEAMEKEYQKAQEVIFSYWYRCCVFIHNICGDLPEVLEGMLDFAEFYSLECFVGLRCPLVLASSEDAAVREHRTEMAEESNRDAPLRV